jgi:hypothetical protein
MGGIECFERQASAIGVAEYATESYVCELHQTIQSVRIYGEIIWNWVIAVLLAVESSAFVAFARTPLRRLAWPLLQQTPISFR